MASLITGNKFDPNTDIPDLSNKVYIVTGGTAGIGFGISAHILQHNPAKLYLLSKKEQHGEEAQKELEKYGDVSQVEFIQCDFENLKQVNEVAKKLSKLEKLDGVSRSPCSATLWNRLLTNCSLFAMPVWVSGCTMRQQTALVGAHLLAFASLC